MSDNEEYWAERKRMQEAAASSPPREELILTPMPVSEELHLYGGATALSRAHSGGSRPLNYWRAAGFLEGDVLDFGSGKDLHEFAKYDPVFYPDIAPLRREYDVILCSYVLNVQPSDHLIDLICLGLRGILRPAGILLAAVVTDSNLSGTDACGRQHAKDASEWEALLGRWFDVHRESAAGFCGFVCSR